MKIRYKVSLLLIGLMLVGCMFITHSYALWIMTEEQTNENNVEVGCFSIGYEEQTESINLSNTYPVDDTTGLNSNPYTFTITNTCTINNNYVVTLNTLSTNTLDVSNIKYAIYKNGEDKPTVGSKLSRVNNDLENLSIENLGTSYILDTGVLGGGTKESEIVSGGEEVTYNLYLWIDNEATNDVEGQKFEASINIITAATESANSGELVANEIVKCGQEGTSAVDCISNNAYLDTTNLAYDGTEENNLRYIGANPNNYVTFNGTEKWRIIGVMKNVTNVETNGQENLLKIVRTDSIGDYSWDSSSSGVNSGYGVNEWSQADAMKLLNPEEVYNEEPEIGGSLYWNRGSGNCYNGPNDTNIPCQFANNGMSDEAKTKIAKIRWYTGTFEISNQSEWTASATYLAERGNHNGKEQCINSGGGENCTDEVGRTTTWDGYVGLINASDFGYAVGGNVRTICLGKSMDSYNADECNINNWLNFNNIYWTINPSPHSLSSTNSFRVLGDGFLSDDTGSNYGYSIRPVVYLNAATRIVSGNGTETNPFILE